MSTHILQHKSWHVYSQKNRDKVRRDEAKAEDEQKQIQDRSIAADREHRLALLRERAQKRQSNIIGGDAPEKEHSQTDRGSPVAEDTMALVRVQDPPVKTQHVNFWPDLEKQDTKSKQGNPEREAEEKRKQEKWDRTIAMHLDSGIKGSKPWYTSLHAGSMHSSRKKGDDKEFTKVREDPLNNMKVMLDKRDKAHQERSKSPSSRSRPRKSDISKHSNSEPKMSAMAKLRKERMERERAEQLKARALLNPGYLDPKIHHQPVGAYNQQFNPLATTLAHSSQHRSSGVVRPYESERRDGRYNEDRHHTRDRDRDRDRERERERGTDKERSRDKPRDEDRDQRSSSRRHRPY